MPETEMSSWKKILFVRGPEAVEADGIFFHMGIDVEGDLCPAFGELVVGGKGYLDPVADAVHVEDDVLGRFVGNFTGKRAIIPLCLRRSFIAVGMGMADRDGQGVGGILLGDFGQVEEHLEHLLHLHLGGLPVADHRLFYLEGGVFEDRKAGIDRGHDGRPRACPSFRALWTFLAKKMFSTATTSGW